MRLDRLRVQNFRNFCDINVPVSGDIVLLGENRVGKSNLLHAVRLVLDPSLSDSARRLKLSDFWDGCDLSESPQIEVHVDFADFSKNDGETALLTDYRSTSNPEIATLSYVYRKKLDVEETIQSPDDCEFIVYGGENQDNVITNKIRRRIGLDMLGALRDAEGQLGYWRNSPLRPLLEDAIAAIPIDQIDEVTSSLEEITDMLGNFETVTELEESIRNEISSLTGSSQDIDARLRFLTSDPSHLLRSISMFIDDGKRSISEASLGSANIALIALKLAEFSLRRAKNERTFSLLCVEEPEAHLHPHLQRSVFEKIFRDEKDDQSLLVTTHSPTLVTTAPLRSIVHLRHDADRTRACSMAKLPMSKEEFEDIERYMNETRSEILFSRGVIFVEGDAEEVLVPVLAQAMEKNLDHLGISVCNIGGIHFSPYVKLATALGLKFSVVTDWDPCAAPNPPLGKNRAMNIWDACSEVSTEILKLTPDQRTSWINADDREFRSKWSEKGIFLNEHTFEASIASTPGLQELLLDILDEHSFGPIRRSRIAAWREGTLTDFSQLLGLISDIGKGRLSNRISQRISDDIKPPDYIASAINFVTSHV